MSLLLGIDHLLYIYISTEVIIHSIIIIEGCEHCSYSYVLRISVVQCCSASGRYVGPIWLLHLSKVNNSQRG